MSRVVPLEIITGDGEWNWKFLRQAASRAGRQTRCTETKIAHIYSLFIADGLVILSFLTTIIINDVNWQVAVGESFMGFRIKHSSHIAGSFLCIRLMWPRYGGGMPLCGWLQPITIFARLYINFYTLARLTRFTWSHGAFAERFVKWR